MSEGCNHEWYDQDRVCLRCGTPRPLELVNAEVIRKAAAFDQILDVFHAEENMRPVMFEVYQIVNAFCAADEATV